MKKRIGRILALMLTIGMFFTSPGMQVFAEENEDVQTEAQMNTSADNQQEEVQTGEDKAEDTPSVPENQELADKAVEENEKADETASDSTVAVATAPDVSAYAVSGNLFDDVSDDSWYLPYVTYTLNKGIMTGKGNNLFAPSEALARAQFATVLWRISGSQQVEYSEVYPDVLDGQFYTTPVLWASGSDVGVITGYDNGKFGPGDNITREQLVTMLYRYAKYRKLDMTHSNDLSTFPDAGSVTEFAFDAMKWAVGSGIITGDKGRLNPQGNTNRAECAAILQRFCETYMAGELVDIDLSANCDQSNIALSDQKKGEFWMKASGIHSSREITGVQARAWCYDDWSDATLYDLTLQEDGSYGALGSPKNHGYHTGTYKMQIYVMLDIGVRVPVGDIQTVEVTGTTGYFEVMSYAQKVYDEVGYDLNACFWWVVNNISYRTLPIPLEPAEGYTRAEWYAMQAFTTGSGNCYVYAAAFYFLAIGLGYNAEFIEGEVGLAAGGYGPHGWVMIYQDGAAYICDPECQRSIGGYNFYMQPAGSPILQYRW